MYRSNYPFGTRTEHEIPQLENSLPFPPNSYFALLEVIKIHHVGGHDGLENTIRYEAPGTGFACMQIGGQFGAYIRKDGGEEGGVAVQVVEGVGGMNRNLGENFTVYSRRVSTYKCHREGNSECKEEEEERGGCSVTVLRRGKRMPRRWMRARRKSLHFIAGLKGLQSNA